MDELTSIVTSTLEARGVLNKIRAELRANVFTAIQEQQGAPDTAPNPALETLQRTSHGQVAAKLMHELLLSCSLDYSLAVMLPEAGLTELELPDRPALAASLGLDAAGEEPLLAQLVRMHMLAGARPAPAATTATAAAAATIASVPVTARERGGPSSTLRDLPPLGKPAGGGAGMLGDLPPLGGRGGAAPKGAVADEQEEEERRLDAIESKLAGLAGLPASATAPPPTRLAASAPVPSTTLAAAAPVSTGSADVADFEDSLEIDEEIEDDFEEDVDSDAAGSQLSQSFGSAGGPLMAGGPNSFSASLQSSRAFEGSMDETMSPTRLQREMQGFDHIEDAEPLRAPAQPAAGSHLGGLPPLGRPGGPPLAGRRAAPPPAP